MNKQSAFINEESDVLIVKENEEEKLKELKRKRNRERQRAYYQRQKDLKKNEKTIKKKKKTVPKSNAERQRNFRQRNKEKSYVNIKRQKLDSNEENVVQCRAVENIENVTLEENQFHSQQLQIYEQRNECITSEVILHRNTGIPGDDNMTSKPTSINLADYDLPILEDPSSIAIKNETDANLISGDHSEVQIKIETDNDCAINGAVDNDHDPFENIQLEVKQEIDLKQFDKGASDMNHDSQIISVNDEKIEHVKNENDKIVDNEMIVSLCQDENFKQEISMEDDRNVGYDFPDFGDTRSLDSNDAAALGNVEACLQEEYNNIKSEDEKHYYEDQTMNDNVDVKIESEVTVTETHLISNKLINTTSTVTNPQDGLSESQTTKTLVMQILPVTQSGFCSESFSKIGNPNPEEILPIKTSIKMNEATDMDYDDIFQLNSITGNVLSLEQEAYGLLKAKNKIDKQEKIYDCPECTKTYKSASCLKKHLEVHRGIERRAQGIIQGRKTRIENKNKKLKTETDEKKQGYVCSCGKTFQRKSRLETCLRSHNAFSEEKLCFVCVTCTKEFKDKEELSLHRRRSHRKKFPCKFCPTDYNTRKELFEHLQIHQEVQLTEYKVISEVIEGKQKLRCFICSKTWADLSDLKHHVMEDHREPYVCPRCKGKFPKIIDFANHTKTLHPEVEGKSVLDVLEAFSKLVKAWKCEECELQFHEADKLALHQIEKHSPDIKSEMQFQCANCRRVFVSQKGLTSHRRVHHSTDSVDETELLEKGVMCLECRKMCKDMVSLASHMRFHSLDRKYPCKFCDFRFATPEKRKAHIDIHTGDMKFVCFICEYQCSSENRLKHHKMSLKHLNMKEYLLTGKPLVEEEETTSKQQKIKDTLRKKEWGIKKRKKKEEDSDSASCSEGDEATCDICGEKFSSESKMLDHKQSHPFIEFPNDDKPTRIFFK